MDFSLFNFLTQAWKAELLTFQWRGSQDMGLPVLKASQLQAMQFGHQTCPLRVNTTSITAIVQIMLWVPGTPKYLAHMASSVLESAQSSLLGLLLTVPLVFMSLCPQRGQVSLQACGWCSATRLGCLWAWWSGSLEVAIEEGWKEWGYTWDWLSPSLHVWYGILRSERINLNVDFRVILKVSFSRWHNRTPFIYLLAWFII